MTHDRWLVVAMAAVWAAAGLVAPYDPYVGQPENVVVVVKSIVLAILHFEWCKAHARTHSIQMPTHAPILVGLVVVVGVPYYAFRGYPLRRALLLLISAIATLIAFIALSRVCFAISKAFGP